VSDRIHQQHTQTSDQQWPYLPQILKSGLVCHWDRSCCSHPSQQFFWLLYLPKVQLYTCVFLSSLVLCLFLSCSSSKRIGSVRNGDPKPELVMHKGIAQMSNLFPCFLQVPPCNHCSTSISGALELKGGLSDTLFPISCSTYLCHRPAGLRPVTRKDVGMQEAC
jgi:hypothetical protein